MCAMGSIGFLLRTASVAVVLTLAIPGTPVLAQSWPRKPVRLIYPYSAGSTGDAAARVLAQRLSQAFGQPFIVENRVGANGALAAEAVARSPADGHTLLWAATPLIAISPAMTKVSYHPVKDFAPISAISAFSFGLVVNPKVPVTDVAGFVDYVRAQPKPMAYAEGGFGSISHLAMVLFLNRASLKMTNVSYRGNEPALSDVIAGHLPTMMSVLGDAASQAVAANVRLLAVTGGVRSPLAPSVPTLSESGYPGFDVGSWHGLLAPAGTPKTIVERIAAEVVRVSKEPGYIEQLSGHGVVPLGKGPGEFAGMISADIELWGKALQLAGGL
jgi:tripartite-type tricarboxylate transporter receptor subunit TctC